jgi:hypothetical protein
MKAGKVESDETTTKMKLLFYSELGLLRLGCSRLGCYGLGCLGHGIGISMIVSFLINVDVNIQ